MATSVIDALVVTLGLDASDYQKKRKEVSAGLKDTREDANTTAKEMETQGKRAAGFFSSIKNELLALAGVSLSVAGVSSFVRNTTSGLQQLAIQSQALGMSARQLDGWSKAAQSAGSSAEKITGTLGSFQNFLQNYRSMGKGSGPISDALAMLSGDTGVTFDPANMDSGDLMRTVEQALKKERNGDRARQIGIMLGLDDATIQAMRSGQFSKDADRLTRQSGVTEADVKNAQRFNREWTDLQQKLEKTSYVIYGSLSPYVEQFTGYLTELADWMAQHPKEIKASIDSFFGTISSVAKICDEAAQSVGGWKNAILLLVGVSVGGKLLGFLSKFSGGLLGLTKIPLPPWLLGAAAYANYAVEDKENIKDSAESSWRYTKQNVGDALDSIGIKNDIGSREVSEVREHPKWMDWLLGPGKVIREGQSNGVVHGNNIQPDIPSGSNLSKPSVPEVSPGIPSGSIFPQVNERENKTADALDDLSSGQRDARRDFKRAGDESKEQRNKTNDILGKILEFFVPSVSADTREPNLLQAPPGAPAEPSASGKKLLDSLTGIFSDTENKYGLPPGLLRSVATVESSGNANAVSPAGAQGLFQFMPGTARDMGLRGNDVFDPHKSTDAAGRYLRQLLKQTGQDLPSALAAYNWGIGNVQKKGLSQAPKETRQYVPKVLAGIQPGAGMTVDRSPPPAQAAQASSQYHIGNVTVQSSANRVDQLTADLGHSVQNRTRALGFDTRQTS
jgi:Soluble lytic murein transglycosylase and related regulatory proteins (some contain LysM/invasin domains)